MAASVFVAQRGIKRATRRDATMASMFLFANEVDNREGKIRAAYLCGSKHL